MYLRAEFYTIYCWCCNGLIFRSVVHEPVVVLVQGIIIPFEMLPSLEFPIMNSSLTFDKCKKLKSLKQCLTATRPTSHN